MILVLADSPLISNDQGLTDQDSGICRCRRQRLPNEGHRRFVALAAVCAILTLLACGNIGSDFQKVLLCSFRRGYVVSEARLEFVLDVANGERTSGQQSNLRALARESEWHVGSTTSSSLVG